MKKKIFFLFLIICLSIVPFSALADNSVNESDVNEPVDLNRKGSINIVFTHRGVVFENEPVELYKIATISTNYVFTPTKEFEDMGVVLNGAITKGEWNTIRTTIDSYIVAEKILPMEVDFTDENGQITFDNLEPGMYFTSSVRTAKDNIGYRFDSMLSSLPNLKDGSPIYDVDINTKPYRDNPLDEKVKYRVTKLWKDEGQEKSRPTSIEVSIFKDKVPQETVVLNAENNWFYSWEAEDDGSEWTVSEKIDSDMYVPLVEKKDATFVLINTHKDVPIDDTGESGSERPSDDAETGDDTDITTYIVIMSLSGMALVILSLIGNKKISKNMEN